MPSEITLARPSLTEADISAVVNVLNSEQLVQGSCVAEFEAALAQRCQRRFAVCVSSGTAALSLAFEVSGVGPGTTVIVPALTWPSPMHAAAKLGARVMLADVSQNTWNITPATLKETIERARKESDHVVAVVIDQFGFPLEKTDVLEAASDVTIIEDAACALGSTFVDGTPCGSLGTLSTLSFHPRKVLTTGEGGACLTDDVVLAKRLRRLRNHGQAGPGQFSEPGLNYRMTDMAAALGRSQLSRFEQTLAKRRLLVQYYADAFSDAPIALQGISDRARSEAVPDSVSSFRHSNGQTLGIVVPELAQKELLLERSQKASIQCGPLSYALSQLEWSATIYDRVPNAEYIAAHGLALPLHTKMTNEDVARVVEFVRNVTG